MEHMRIVAPADRSKRVLDLLLENPSVCNVVFLEGVARRPEGDVILCDVAREDTSVVISDLKELDIHEDGSIALELIDTQLSKFAHRAEANAHGAAADAVVWEEVEERSSENVELSGVFVIFMVLAAFIAAVGIFLNSPILIVGAMVVGPEFGPIAGLCVALVQRRKDMAVRSAVALTTGFPLAITSVFLLVLVFKATNLVPGDFDDKDHNLSSVIASPDFFAFFVAACAGAAGMLSLSTAKSGALIGVLISVTTIPAAANVGISAAYADWAAWRGSLAQLGINLGSILLAGTLTLLVQRMLYRRRRLQHLRDPSRSVAGLPVGRSRRSRSEVGAKS
ncbi:MAG TPA: DUF389 domain-containing protein [Solirubrobacteraceae bacterium]|jgi:uncharacterized hydrophobic protein (TIGR00271 family)